VSGRARTLARLETMEADVAVMPSGVETLKLALAIDGEAL
jgi:hypothetical protein